MVQMGDLIFMVASSVSSVNLDFTLKFKTQVLLAGLARLLRSRHERAGWLGCRDLGNRTENFLHMNLLALLQCIFVVKRHH